MSTTAVTIRSRTVVTLVAALTALSLVAGGWALGVRRLDPSAQLGSITGVGAARATVAVGAVANGAGVGGDDVVTAARLGLDDALAGRAGVARVSLPVGASRGARVVGGRNDHVIDGTVSRVVRAPGRVLVEASVVVSSMPGRVYQFASSSTITLTGAAADTDDGLHDAVRRAMRSATTHAVDQMTAP
jgi:hypothetical protein